VRPAIALTGIVLTAVLIGGAVAFPNVADAHLNHASGLDFHLASFDGGAGCTSALGYKGNCSVGQGDSFAVQVHLDYITDLGNGEYDELGAAIAYSGGLTPQFDADMSWTGCAIESDGAPPEVSSECTVIPGYPPSTYIGIVMTATFDCEASGQLTLLHNSSDTFAVDSKDVLHTEDGPDVMNVTCVPPTATAVPATATATAPPPAIGGISREPNSATGAFDSAAHERSFGMLALAAVAGAAAASVLALRLRR
jgi:hypothetical protein